MRTDDFPQLEGCLKEGDEILQGGKPDYASETGTIIALQPVRDEVCLFESFSWLILVLLPPPTTFVLAPTARPSCPALHVLTCNGSWPHATCGGVATS